MEINLHAIEPTRSRGKRRVDGVGRPKFDFHTGLVAVALFILIGWAYHTKLSEEERKDKCAPCRAALLTVTNRDTAVMDEAEQALGLKASKD